MPVQAPKAILYPLWYQQCRMLRTRITYCWTSYWGSSSSRNV